MTDDVTPDVGAEQMLSQMYTELALNNPTELGEVVAREAGNFKQAIADQIAAGRQFEADLAELQSKADLIPPHGWQRLKAEAVNEAQAKHQDADHRAEQALPNLKAALTEAALPKLNPARESLARQELATVIGEASGRGVIQRASNLAQHGSREALAALLTPYGKSLLIARGVEGQDFAEAMKLARAHGAYTAKERGETTREILAGSILEHIDKLGAARGFAGSYTLHLLNRHGH